MARWVQLPAPEVTDPFVHLHVASGYSMRYGANHPADLVARAAEHGMDGLALTDRDGLYGAVKFALACRSAGVRPIFGVDLAVAPALDTALPPALGPPARGAARAPPAPAARQPVAGRRPGPGWGERRPAAAPGHLPGPGRRRLAVAVPADQRHPPARHARGAGELAGDRPPSTPPALVALLGPDSAVGRALAAGRPDLAAGPAGRLAGRVRSAAGWCSRSSTTAARATGRAPRRCCGSPPSSGCRWC